MEKLTSTNGLHTATINKFLESFSVKEVRNLLFEMYGLSLNPVESSVEFAANSFFYVKIIVEFLEKLEAEKIADYHENSEARFMKQLEN